MQEDILYVIVYKHMCVHASKKNKNQACYGKVYCHTIVATNNMFFSPNL